MAKAAIWCGLAGVAQIALNVFPGAFEPPFYFFVVAVGYALILPMIAMLHVRERRRHESGAVLGTITGTAAVLLGIVTSVDPALGTVALFVRGMWWWTIGKMWWERSTLPPLLGVITMALAAFAFVAALVPTFLMPALDTILGLWLLAVSAALFRAR